MVVIKGHQDNSPNNGHQMSAKYEMLSLTVVLSQNLAIGGSWPTHEANLQMPYIGHLVTNVLPVRSITNEYALVYYSVEQE